VLDRETPASYQKWEMEIETQEEMWTLFASPVAKTLPLHRWMSVSHFAAE